MSYDDNISPFMYIVIYYLQIVIIIIFVCIMNEEGLNNIVLLLVRPPILVLVSVALSWLTAWLCELSVMLELNNC